MGHLDCHIGDGGSPSLSACVQAAYWDVPNPATSLHWGCEERWMHICFYTNSVSQLCVAMTTPGKNNTEEERFIFCSQFQTMVSWLHDRNIAAEESDGGELLREEREKEKEEQKERGRRARGATCTLHIYAPMIHSFNLAPVILIHTLHYDL